MVDRRVQPRARPDLDEHRLAAVRPARASGAWATYGLGSESQDLPGFVVFSTGQEGAQRRHLELGQRLPADRLPGRPVPQPGRPGPVPLEPAGRRRAAPARLARRARASSTSCGSDAVGDPEIATRINSFEMAYRMQIERPRADGPLAASRRRPSRCTAPSRASRRSPTTACWPAGWSSAACASCRLFHEAWDQHGDLIAGPEGATAATPTRPRAALVKDLKQRGLLDDTLVIWGGEFGRTPMVQGGNDGRDHHPNALHDVAGRRRHQAGHHARRDRRLRLQRRRATASTSTTCTPRSCTCSGFDHTQADLPLPGPRLPPDRRRTARS